VNRKKPPDKVVEKYGLVVGEKQSKYDPRREEVNRKKPPDKIIDKIVDAMYGLTAKGMQADLRRAVKDEELCSSSERSDVFNLKSVLKFTVRLMWLIITPKRKMGFSYRWISVGYEEEETSRDVDEDVVSLSEEVIRNPLVKKVKCKVKYKESGSKERVRTSSWGMAVNPELHGGSSPRNVPSFI
jgi:hypothetical protein